MFFSTELLSRRDSGYGLLWLAATLGSKFKKLPRRSVITADIHQLCNLISEPPEPLALRLSSNLMVGVVRVFKLKHEIFHTEVTNCFTSLKKTLQELHSMSDSTLDMAQPNGIRFPRGMVLSFIDLNTISTLSPEALDIAADPGIAMLTEFDVNDMDWDIVFRKAESIIDGEDFNADPPAQSSSFAPTNRKLYQLEESYEHLFSASFLNSLSGEAEDVGNDKPSSSANDVLFDLDFGGDPDVGLGEEMERELQEAWNLKPKQSEDEVAVVGKGTEFEGVPMDLDPAFGGDAGGGIDFGNTEFDGFEPAFNDEGVIAQHERDERINPYKFTEENALHTPPPHDKAPPRSCLSRRSSDIQLSEDAEDEHAQPQGDRAKTGGRKRPRKKVTLIDPRTELTDEQLKFQRDNYANEMKRLGREAQKKEELREGKRRFEELLWAPPNYFVAPELIEWYNQRVVYPVKARETAWKMELEELQNPKKRRRTERDLDEELDERPIHDVQDIADYAMDIGLDYMGEFDDGLGMDVFENSLPPQEDPQAASRRSSDSPGLPRRGTSRPASPLKSSLIGHSTFLDKADPALNSLFPWDHTGPSSSSAPAPGSFGMGGGSDLGLSMDSVIVRVKRSSRSGSRSDSPSGFGCTGSQQLDGRDVRLLNTEGSGLDLEAVASFEDENWAETQESESMVTLEKNSFNFLEYAKMHMLSNSNPLLFSDLVPTDSSSARVAAEGFYHCLALATKGLIDLEQNEAYGPIRIRIK